MTSEVTYKLEEKDLNNFMQKLSSEMVLSWLTGVRLSSPTVCDILKVSPRTLTNWINAGRLIVKNDGERSHEFDMSDVVKLYLTKNKKLA